MPSSALRLLPLPARLALHAGRSVVHRPVESYARDGDPVPPTGRFEGDLTASASSAAADARATDRVARLVGAGRVGFGAALLAAPEQSVQALGVDTASARRLAFLARMAGARDLGIGLGTLATRGRRESALWLLAGALADATDAAALGLAVRERTVARVPGLAVVGLGSAATLLSVRAALAARRQG